MPFRIGPMELIIVLVIIMIVFGVGKLPQVGGAMGRGLREFRKARSEIDEVTKLEDEVNKSSKGRGLGQSRKS